MILLPAEEAFITVSKERIKMRCENFLQQIKQDIHYINHINEYNKDFISEQAKQKALDNARIIAGCFIDEIQNLTMAKPKVPEADIKAELERGQGQMPGNKEVKKKKDTNSVSVFTNLNYKQPI